VLQLIKVLSADSDWLFPTQKGEGHILATSVDHAIRKNLTVFNLPAFIPHDLRRTAASHMTAKGISRLVVSKLLNHVELGVTAVYDRHSYDQDKRSALETSGKVFEEYITIATRP
jgi:site-specific recombinase XerD